MKLFLNNFSDSLFDSNIKGFIEKKTTMEIFEPKLSKSSDGSCNPLFFKPDNHSKHMII